MMSAETARQITHQKRISYKRELITQWKLHYGRYINNSLHDLILSTCNQGSNHVRINDIRSLIIQHFMLHDNENMVLLLLNRTKRKLVSLGYKWFDYAETNGFVLW